MEISKRRKYESKGSGFTLVELVIVIAIVIVLSVVSVPIYRSYVDKAKMSEGYTLLGTILSAQKAYYSEHGNFLRLQETVGETSYEPILGIDARGNKYFTYFHDATQEDKDPKIFFQAGVFYPEEVLSGRKRILLRYDITKGIEFVDPY